ncbi:MAG: Na+/H+ antiporter subunit E [Proteobacteria bacterium]|nr:Na+/H+ antiporter subunit E [Pseudomonadota bacterium]
MLQAISLAAALTAFWVLLSGYWIPLILCLGAASILACVYIARRMEIIDHEGHPIHISFQGITYFPWLLKEIVLSNIAVAKAILKGGSAIRPQVLQVPASQRDALGQVIYANSITLTPGTVSIGIDEGVITVHALMDETADGLRTGDMNARVCRLEGDPDPRRIAGGGQP